MAKKSILCVFSNKTHLETALPVLVELKDEYQFIGVFNFISTEYSVGLNQLLKQHNELFIEHYSIEEITSYYERYIVLLRLKKFIITCHKKMSFSHSLQFSEGGDVDWLVIGVLKSLNVKTVVMQWAITWEPKFYDRRQDYPMKVKFAVNKAIKKLLNIDYLMMSYLGDGGADYLLTMGEHWTKQFQKFHDKPKKFITTGNPRFQDLAEERSQDKTIVLLITGAATMLRGYDKSFHIQDIKDIYEAYNDSMCDLTLIHRVHPRDNTIDSIKKLAAEFENVELSLQGVTQDWLPKAKIVILIRSTVGLEALLAGANLIVFNNGRQEIGFNYADNNLAVETKTKEQLATVLSNYKELKKVADSEINHFVKTDNVMKIIKSVFKQN